MDVPIQSPPWDTFPEAAIASALQLLMRQTEALERVAATLASECAHESVDTYAAGAGRRVDVCMACMRILQFWNEAA